MGKIDINPYKTIESPRLLSDSEMLEYLYNGYELKHIEHSQDGYVYIFFRRGEPIVGQLYFAEEDYYPKVLFCFGKDSGYANFAGLMPNDDNCYLDFVRIPYNGFFDKYYRIRFSDNELYKEKFALGFAQIEFHGDVMMGRRWVSIKEDKEFQPLFAHFAEEINKRIDDFDSYWNIARNKLIDEDNNC